MGYWLDEGREQHEFVTVRTVWVTATLSVLVHVAALFLVLERTHLLAPPEEPSDTAGERLQVRLAAPPAAPAVAAQPARETVALAKPPPRAPRPPAHKPPPPVLAAVAPPIPVPVLPKPPTPPAPTLPTPPATGDLWDYLQARRRERGAADTPAVPSPPSDANANLAANLPTAATGVATADPRRGGGVFEIKRMTYDDAAFLFFGWNQEMGRSTPQLIEVRKGNNSGMCIAVVRKMISIIRQYEKGDFVWRNTRRDNVTLSARPSDNAALEDYLMRDMRDSCDNPDVQR